VLLKLYIYGYLNRIQSSRRLEREAQRNVELMWLTGRLAPDFKAIANFRKDNGKAIRNVCRQRRMEEIEANISRYLAELDTADRQELRSSAIEERSSQRKNCSVKVPETKTSGAKADGRFDKADFIYDPQKNEYRCPAGQSLIWRFASIEKGMKNHRYWSSNWQGCPLKEKCTPSAQRRVTRWEHHDVLDEMQTRLEQNPDAMRIRRSTVEHPYGTAHNDFSYSEPSPVPCRQLPDSHFAFLHSLSRVRPSECTADLDP
jgi:hypothetical protein